MSISTILSVGWPKPTGLSVKKQKNGAGHIGIFSWNKISNDEVALLDPSGGGYYKIFWRVKINDYKTYLVYDNPTFKINIPLGCCKLCVKVQTVYDLSETNYTYSDQALSEYCEEVCVDCDPDTYCESVKSKTTTITQNYGSAKMRYARAIRIGGANAFR